MHCDKGFHCLNIWLPALLRFSGSTHTWGYSWLIPCASLLLVVFDSLLILSLLCHGRLTPEDRVCQALLSAGFQLIFANGNLWWKMKDQKGERIFLPSLLLEVAWPIAVFLPIAPALWKYLVFFLVIKAWCCRYLGCLAILFGFSAFTTPNNTFFLKKLQSF